VYRYTKLINDKKQKPLKKKKKKNFFLTHEINKENEKKTSWNTILIFSSIHKQNYKLYFSYLIYHMKLKYY